MDYEALRGKLNHALAELEHLLIPEGLLEFNEGLTCTAGGYADVYRAILREPDRVSSRVVAVKELRAVGNDVARIRLAIRLARELRVWSRLNHPNVLELIGYHLNPQMTTARFISPFLTNGNIDEYLENAPGLVSHDIRLKLLRDSLNGLVYLHSLDPPICHADIKPGNVLVTDWVEAVLCDFGLARLADGQPSGLTTTKTVKGSIRYMSPELLEENARHTLSSDVWAYGCLVLKVMTGALPYANASLEVQILTALVGKQPPADLADSKFQGGGLEPLLTICWNMVPSARPSASECLHYLPEPGPGDLGLPSMKDSSSSIRTHSQDCDRHGTSPCLVWSSEFVSGAQWSAEPATQLSLRPFKIEEAASPSSVTHSQHVVHNPPEFRIDPTHSSDSLPSTATTPEALAPLNLTEITGIRDTNLPQDSFREPDYSGTETAPEGTEGRITPLRPPQTKDQSLPLNQADESSHSLLTATPRGSQSATPPAITPAAVSHGVPEDPKSKFASSVLDVLPWQWHSAESGGSSATGPEVSKQNRNSTGTATVGGGSQVPIQALWELRGDGSGVGFGFGGRGRLNFCSMKPPPPV